MLLYSEEYKTLFKRDFNGGAIFNWEKSYINGRLVYNLNSEIQFIEVLISTSFLNRFLPIEFRLLTAEGYYVKVLVPLF